MPRILLLDDEPLIAMMVADWLTEIGCETVGPADTVAAALQLIEEAGPDGAILDVSLGSGNSFAVAETLRRRGIPFAFATGHGADKLALGFADSLILSKPFDFAAVKGFVSRLLDGREATEVAGSSRKPIATRNY